MEHQLSIKPVRETSRGYRLENGVPICTACDSLGQSSGSILYAIFCWLGTHVCCLVESIFPMVRSTCLLVEPTAKDIRRPSTTKWFVRNSCPPKSHSSSDHNFSSPNCHQHQYIHFQTDPVPRVAALPFSKSLGQGPRDPCTRDPWWPVTGHVRCFRSQQKTWESKRIHQWISWEFMARK